MRFMQVFRASALPLLFVSLRARATHAPNRPSGITPPWLPRRYPETITFLSATTRTIVTTAEPITTLSETTAPSPHLLPDGGLFTFTTRIKPSIPTSRTVPLPAKDNQTLLFIPAGSEAHCEYSVLMSACLPLLTLILAIQLAMLAGGNPRILLVLLAVGLLRPIVMPNNGTAVATATKTTSLGDERISTLKTMTTIYGGKAMPLELRQEHPIVVPGLDLPDSFPPTNVENAIVYRTGEPGRMFPKSAGERTITPPSAFFWGMISWHIAALVFAVLVFVPRPNWAIAILIASLLSAVAWPVNAEDVDWLAGTTAIQRVGEPVAAPSIIGIPTATPDHILEQIKRASESVPDGADVEDTPVYFPGPFMVLPDTERKWLPPYTTWSYSHTLPTLLSDVLLLGVALYVVANGSRTTGFVLAFVCLISLLLRGTLGANAQSVSNEVLLPRQGIEAPPFTTTPPDPAAAIPTELQDAVVYRTGPDMIFPTAPPSSDAAPGYKAAFSPVTTVTAGLLTLITAVGGWMNGHRRAVSVLLFVALLSSFVMKAEASQLNGRQQFFGEFDSPDGRVRFLSFQGQIVTLGFVPTATPAAEAPEIVIATIAEPEPETPQTERSIRTLTRQIFSTATQVVFTGPETAEVTITLDASEMPKSTVEESYTVPLSTRVLTLTRVVSEGVTTLSTSTTSTTTTTVPNPDGEGEEETDDDRERNGNGNETSGASGLIPLRIRRMDGYAVPMLLGVVAVGCYVYSFMWA